MKNSPASQISSILFLLLMCSGIVVSVIFYRKLQESNRLNEQLVKNLELSRDSTRQILAALKNIEIIIAAPQSDSISKAEPPKSVPLNGHPAPAPEKPAIRAATRELSNILQRVQKADNSVYEVAVYAYNSPSDLLPKAAAYFSRNGYRLTDTATLRTAQSWLAKQPAVIYYGDDNKKRAATLAAELSQATGLRFITQQGAGYGVPQEMRPYTFKIHIVR